MRARSLLVSLVTTLLDVGLFSLLSLVLAGTGALLAARWLSGAIGASSNFALNRLFAFRQSGASLLGQLGRYALTALLSVTLATLCFALLLATTSLDPRLLHPASLGLVWLCFTFPMLRRFVFRATSPSRP